MNVTEISPTATPHLFYMGREDLLNLDADGNPTIIYDVQVRQDITAEGIKYTRKSEKGVRQTILTPFSATLLNGVDEESLTPIMTQHIIQEVSTDGGATWFVPEVTDRAIDADADGLIDYLLTVGSSSYCRISTVDNYFLEKCGKQEYEISAPGALTRLYLEATLHDLEQSIVDISDFDGPCIYNTYVNSSGETVVVYLFYPAGVEYAVIDPYLSVTEVAATITVSTDSAPFFRLVFDATKGGVIDEWYYGNGGVTNISHTTYGVYCIQTTTDITRYQSESAASEIVIIESSPIRVVLRASGVYGNTAGYTFVQHITIYPSGYLFFETRFTNTTGSTLTFPSYLFTVSVNTNPTTYTNETRLYDNADSTPVYGESDWLGMFTPDGMPSVFACVLYADAKAQQVVSANATNRAIYQASSGSLGNGESVLHSAVLYLAGFSDTDAEIDADFTQYFRDVPPTIVDSLGSFATDWNSPATIDAGAGMTSDGVHQIVTSGGEAKLSINQATNKQAFVVDNGGSVKSGTVASPAEHLLAYLSCGGLVNTSYLYDEKNDTSNVFSVANYGSAAFPESTRGNGFYNSIINSTYIVFSNATIGISPADFSILLNMTPSWDNEVTANGYIFSYYNGANDRIYLSLNGSGSYGSFAITVGSVTGSIVLSKKIFYTGVSHALLINVKYVSGVVTVVCLCNGAVIGLTSFATTFTPSGSFTGYVGNYLGNDGELDSILDDIKFYNTNVFPFGHYIPGNVIDQSLWGAAHSSIKLYWGCNSDVTPIGSDITAKDGAYTGTGIDGVANSAFVPTASTGYAKLLTSGNLSSAEFTIQIWGKNFAALTANGTLFYVASNFKVEWNDATNILTFTYGTASVSTAAFTDANDHCIIIRGKASTSISIENNGVRVQNTTSIPVAPTLDSDMYFCNSSAGTSCLPVTIDEVIITDSCGTPPVWTAGGKPVHQRLLTRG